MDENKGGREEMTSADIGMELRRGIIDGAIVRAYGCLRNAVEPNEVAACMYAIETGERLLTELKDTDRRDEGPTAEQIPESPKVEEPKPTLTKDEVKAKLLELSGKYDALDVAALMEGMGYTRLSDVPAVKYQELLDKADAAVKELA